MHNKKLSSSESLSGVISRYSNHPDFIGIEISGVNTKGSLDDTILHLAVRVGDLHSVKILVESGAEVNAVGDIGNTPLHYAAMGGHFECAKYLLKKKASKQKHNEFDQKPYEVSILAGHDDLANILR